MKKEKGEKEREEKKNNYGDSKIENNKSRDVCKKGVRRGRVGMEEGGGGVENENRMKGIPEFYIFPILLYGNSNILGGRRENSLQRECDINLLSH